MIIKYLSSWQLLRTLFVVTFPAHLYFPVFLHVSVIPLADYYIIAGVVYQAPDLGTVISSRVV